MPFVFINGLEPVKLVEYWELTCCWGRHRACIVAGCLVLVGAVFPVLSNPSPALNEAYMITGVPETFIIDAEGILRQKFIGPNNWNTWEMRNLILGMVDQKSPQQKQ